MSVRKINESTLTAIGNAIRSKTGGSALINPEDMASEIENITGGGIVLPPNILDGSDWEAGYFSQSGGITAQSVTHKEVYTTNYIEVIPGAPYFIALKCDGIPSNGALWCGLAFYDENKAFISRVVPSNMSGRAIYPTVDYFAPTSATKYIRVSFRKYNKAFCYISNSGDFIDSLGEVLEVIS